MCTLIKTVPYIKTKPKKLSLASNIGIRKSETLFGPFEVIDRDYRKKTLGDKD